MSRVEFHFHAELNDFLAPVRRGAAVIYRFSGRVSIKDAIESLGVPHTEIAAIVVGSTAVDFAYIVRDSDHVEVFPRPAPAAHAPLRPPFPGPPRFVLDTHLGQLASYLRMLGFDTLYRNDYADEELARIASQDPRILLTRDRGLLKRSIVTYGRYVRATDPQAPGRRDRSALRAGGSDDAAAALPHLQRAPAPGAQGGCARPAGTEDPRILSRVQPVRELWADLLEGLAL